MANPMNQISKISSIIMAVLILLCGSAVISIMDLSLSLTVKGFFSKTATLIANIAFVTVALLFLLLSVYALIKEGGPIARLFLGALARGNTRGRSSFLLGVTLAALPFMAFPVSTQDSAVAKLIAIPALLLPSIKALYLATDPSIFTWGKADFICAVLIILCVPCGFLLALQPIFTFHKQTYRAALE